MYVIDELDQVEPVDGIPQCSIGAPLPIAMNSDYNLALAYLLEERDPNWDGTYVKVVEYSTDSSVALVEFQHYYAFMFGPPNDEAFNGHPLASRGLHPYGVFRIAQSSWIRQLERMNSVHPHHNPKMFAGLNHYVFAFHDSTFECIAHSFHVTVHNGSMKQIVSEMQKLLGL